LSESYRFEGVPTFLQDKNISISRNQVVPEDDDNTIKDDLILLDEKDHSGHSWESLLNNNEDCILEEIYFVETSSKNLITASNSEGSILSNSAKFDNEGIKDINTTPKESENNEMVEIVSNVSGALYRLDSQLKKITRGYCEVLRLKCK